jgi:hypothetical protein
VFQIRWLDKSGRWFFGFPKRAEIAGGAQAAEAIRLSAHFCVPAGMSLLFDSPLHRI